MKIVLDLFDCDVVSTCIPIHMVVTWQLHACIHYCDVIMGAMASQITSLTIVYSIVHSGTDQRKHQRHRSLCGEFPEQMAINAENVSIWWRHHGWLKKCLWNWDVLGNQGWDNKPLIFVQVPYYCSMCIWISFCLQIFNANRIIFSSTKIACIVQNKCRIFAVLIHWWSGDPSWILINIISDNSFHRQTITWTNDDSLSTGTLGTN